jgi:transcription elongation factor GreB
MSRAFVRESDEPQLPELPPLVSPLPPGAKNYMTAGGLERLRAEIARLVSEERPPLAAGAAGDMETKGRLQLLDQRIRYLEESARTAEVVPPPAAGSDEEVVRFGATVTVREADKTQTRYRIVGVDETDLDCNWVSWLTPIARALMNARLGQRVTFKAPRGVKELEIMGVEYEG